MSFLKFDKFTEVNHTVSLLCVLIALFSFTDGGTWGG